eukprot:scaffold10357_cov174-Isochrysis_galbana.AAC.2
MVRKVYPGSYEPGLFRAHAHRASETETRVARDVNSAPGDRRRLATIFAEWSPPAQPKEESISQNPIRVGSQWEPDQGQEIGDRGSNQRGPPIPL